MSAPSGIQKPGGIVIMGIVVSVATGMIPSKSSELYGSGNLLMRLEELSRAIPLP